MGKLIFALVLLFPSLAYATDWYARTPCTNNGDGTAVGCAAAPGGAGAWNSLANIVWGGIDPRDTVYIVGTFDANLTVGAEGTSGNHITIRGDHADGAGQIGTAVSGRKIIINNYLTIYEMTVYGSIGGDILVFYGPENIQFIAATNEIRDYGQGIIVAGLIAGESISINGSANNDTKVFKVASTSAEATYDKIIVETEDAFWYVDDEAQVSARLYRSKIYTDTEIDSCKIIMVTELTQPIDPLTTNVTIKNTEIDGNSLDVRGALYWYVSGNWRRPDNILIENNYIHDIGDAVDGGADNHCIGLQAMTNVTITGNTLNNCACAILAYPYSASAAVSILGLTISRNSIENMDATKESTQYGGSGIVLISNAGSCPYCDVADISFNVLSSPLNCPEVPTNWQCLGIHSNWLVKNKIHNNTVDGFSDGISVSGTKADIRNNIVSNSTRYHIKVPNSVVDWTEDNNFFYPDTGTKFYSNGAKNFADYDANHDYNNTFVSLLDPLFVSATDFHLQGASPAKSAGLNLGTGYTDKDLVPLPTPYGWPIGGYGYGNTNTGEGFGRATGSFSGNIQ